MDPTRFDRFARTLSASRPRRTLVGAALAALLASPAGEVAAACRGTGAGCRRDTHCCSGQCTKRGRCRCIRTSLGGCRRGADCCSGVCATGHRDRVCCGKDQILTDDGTCGCNELAGDVKCAYTCCNELLGEQCCEGRCCARGQQCVAGRCVASRCLPGHFPCGARACCRDDMFCCGDARGNCVFDRTNCP